MVLLKSVLRWLLRLFRWGSQTLEPFVDTDMLGETTRRINDLTAKHPPPLKHSDWLYDLAAEVAELRVEIRQLKNQLTQGERSRL